MNYQKRHLLPSLSHWSTGLRLVVIMVVFGGLGLVFIIQSRAATYQQAQELESGDITTATRVPDAGASGGQYVKFGAAGGTGSVKPVIVGHQLQKGDSGERLKMDGVCVWGIQDEITQNGDTGLNGYNNRQKIVDTLKSWGANHIRLRLLASAYNNQSPLSKAEYIKQVKDWRDTVVAAGMYLQIVWWDGLDGDYSDANWAAQYSQAFPAMTDVVNALGDDPMVYYEPFNEPNNVDQAAWLTAMKATVQHFRNELHYTGILLLDMDGWSHNYNDTDMTALETLDAGLTGMNGKHQLIFAKHDYANEFSDPNTFTTADWATNGGAWDFGKHMVWETEYGNYNGTPDTVHLPWSAGATTTLASKVNDGTLAGATAFVYRWVDDNTMVSTDLTTPTEWGGYVKDNFLQTVN